MEINKNIILIYKLSNFSTKNIFLFFLILFSLGINAQNIDKNDSTNIKKDVKVVDLNKAISSKDTIPKDSITNDSIIKNKTRPLKSPDAVDRKIEYSCKDSMHFSMSDKKIFMYGTGVINSDDMNLKAGYIELNTSENFLYAEGTKDSTGNVIQSPIVKQGEDEFKSKTIKYNIKTKKGIITDAKAKKEEGYLHSSISKMYPNKVIHMENGKYTTCDLDHPHFYIKLTKAKVIPGKSVISGPMYFVIADIPLKFIGMPFGFIPNQKKNTSGLIIPRYGEEERRGFFVSDGGWFFAINDNVNASITGSYYSQGGWGVNFLTNFKKRYKYSGNLNIKYDLNRIGEASLPDYQETKTFWVTGTYNQDAKANPNSSFTVNLNFGSSSYNDYNALNIDQFTNNTKSSNISYRRSKPGSIFNFSANVNATQNTKTQQVNLNLPTISFNMKRQFPLKNVGTTKGKWYQKIGIGFSSSAKNSISTIDTLLFRKETLYDMKNGIQYSIPISTSFKVLKHFNVSPSFSYKGRLYASYINKRQVYLPDESGNLKESVAVDTLFGLKHPFDFNFSVPFSTKIYGMFNVNGKRIKALRHVMSPSISYSYRPDFGTDFWGYYDYYNIERNEDETDEEYELRQERTKYSYYQTGIYGTPPKGKSGSIGFSLGNNFEMKVKSKKDTSKNYKKIKLLNNLSFSTSYNIAADSLNLSNLSIRGNTRLFDKLAISFSSSFDPYIRDTLNHRLNKFELTENRRIARFVNGRVSVGGSFSANDFKKDKGKKTKTKTKTKKQLFYYDNPDITYADFDVPWNISINYNFNVTSSYVVSLQTYEKNITQTISLNGGFSLTKNWKFTGRIDYDLVKNDFTYSSINIHRDLHCWEMGLFVIPFGTLKSYNFRINIKSSVFSGLEYKKQQSWHDNF